MFFRDKFLTSLSLPAHLVSFFFLFYFWGVANTPHNPVRFADTVGIVLEQRRPEGALDRLRWYCQSCGGIAHETTFRCTDLGTQIKAAVNAFRDDAEKRRCKHCGVMVDVVPGKSHSS